MPAALVMVSRQQMGRILTCFFRSISIGAGIWNGAGRDAFVSIGGDRHPIDDLNADRVDYAWPLLHWEESRAAIRRNIHL